MSFLSPFRLLADVPLLDIPVTSLTPFGLEEILGRPPRVDGSSNSGSAEKLRGLDSPLRVGPPAAPSVRCRREGARRLPDTLARP